MNAPRAALRSLALLGLAACGGAQPGWAPPHGPTLSTVLVPRGGEDDAPAVLADGLVARDGWYCTHARPPQTFEMMFADGEPRPVRAVAYVPGNLGPDGAGPVEVRVQRGHGIAAHGETFRAEPRGRAEQLHVVLLPHPVEGDHILVTLLRRLDWSTAACLAEVLAYTEAPAEMTRDAAVATGVAVEPGTGSAPAPSQPGSAAPPASAAEP
jgi:hypothetical protein